MNKPAITALLTVQENNTSNLGDSHFMNFGGKPLFQLMVEKLLAVPVIERVVITTDSNKVSELYRNNQKIVLVDFPGREKFSVDSNENILEEMPTSDLITAHALEKTTGEHFLQTQCINPLLSLQTIESVIDHYYNYVLNDEYNQFDSVMSLSRIEKRLYDMSNYPEITLRNVPHFVVFEDTIFHVFNRSHFNRNGKKKFGKNPMFFEVPEIESLAVESRTSYQLAKLAFENNTLFL